MAEGMRIKKKRLERIAAESGRWQSDQEQWLPLLLLR